MPRKSPKKICDQHEEEAMALLCEAAGRKGRRQPASGAVWGYKGDGRIAEVLRMEHKETEKDKYVLKHADLLKIEREASGAEEPILILRFNDRFGCERFVIRRGEAEPGDPAPDPLKGDGVKYVVDDFGTVNKQLTLSREHLSAAMRIRGTLGLFFNAPGQWTDKYRVVPWDKYLEELRSMYLQEEA